VIGAPPYSTPAETDWDIAAILRPGPDRSTDERGRI